MALLPISALIAGLLLKSRRARSETVTSAVMDDDVDISRLLYIPSRGTRRGGEPKYVSPRYTELRIEYG
jgi:hypothetical protein